ncbi:hypothetical protein FB451DRAFT_1055677 [Mycena latifolia]|nr:hypothetical protein FB451DRAFT_1055677 [Mycena latifolia]
MLSSPASVSSPSSASSSSTLASESSYTSGSTCYSPARVHAASLVDPARHSPDLLKLIDSELSPPVIDYIVDCVSETVAFVMGRPPFASQVKREFASFVSTVLARAEVSTPTVLTALVYVARARPHLSIALEQWAHERVWLGALIAASKYTQDSTLKNVHWALCTGVFGVRDVGRIEREFFEVLDWELGVTEAEVMEHYAGLCAREVPHATKPSVPTLAPASLPPSPQKASLPPSAAPNPAPSKLAPHPASRRFKLHALLRAAAASLPIHMHGSAHAHRAQHHHPRRVAVH